MRGARTDFLSTAPVAAAGAALVLSAAAVWPLAALARAISASDLALLLRTDEEVRSAFAWSAMQAMVASVVGVLFGLASAYCWTRLRYPGRTVLRGLAVAPIAIPSVVLASGIQALFARDTLAADLVSMVGLDPIRLQQGTGAVIAAHSLIATASVGWFASVAWASVDARKVDAARTLGAGRLRAARVAVWPAVWPAAAAGAGTAFLQATLSYGVVAILADGRETPEGLTVRLALAGDSRTYGVAALTCGYSVLCGIVTIHFLRQPGGDARRTRPPQRTRGVDRLVTVVAAIPSLVVAGTVAALLLRAVDSGDGLTMQHVRGLFAGSGSSETRRALLGTLLAALPAAVLAATWGGMAGAALGRLQGLSGAVRAVVLLFPLALSPAALGVGWRLAAPHSDPRVTLAIVQGCAAVPFVAGTIARMRPRPRPGVLAAARSLGARRLRAWRVLRGPSYVIAALVGLLVTFGMAVAETSAAAVARVPGGTLTVRLLNLDRQGATGDAAALATAILLIAVTAFALGDPIIARLGRARR